MTSKNAFENNAFSDSEANEEIGLEGRNEKKCSRVEAKEVSSEMVSSGTSTASSPNDITYGVEDVPPWYLCLLLGFQHYMTMVGSTITIPFILTPLLCIADDDPVRGQFISSIIFVSGFVTLLQSTFGIRLAIVQGGTFGFLLPTIAILTTSFPSCDTYDFTNMTSFEKELVWTTRIREVQGAIIVSSLFQVVIGFTGAIGYILSWISPLTIVPTITLVGMSLFKPAASKASGQWGISILTAFLLTLFSQYLTDVGIPYPVFRGSKISWKKAHIFKLFPVILSIFISWIICVILTATDVFPPNSEARTDTKLALLQSSPWIYVPYPFQWGVPTVSVSGVFGMLAGVLSSMIESIGDYYACARLSGVPPPPKHAVNRGIGIEGIGCIIAGLIGTGNGTTSYSENIGAIRVTKVASRRVIQAGALFMIICGMFGKFGAFFVTLPSPVVGGVFLVMFSIITAIGLSNLQVVNLNSSRNVFVLGLSLFCGLAIPEWIAVNSEVIKTGSEILDQVLVVLLRTHMFVGGLIGLILDNTIPGTDEERGIHKWKDEENISQGEGSCYDLPFGLPYIQRHSWCSKIPISPTFKDSPQPTSPVFSFFSRIKKIWKPNDS